MPRSRRWGPNKTAFRSPSPAIQVIRSPSFTVTRAQTTVSAQDGQTVVLGGLIGKNETTISRRVPGLSSIPILGNLFRYDLEISKRSELLIILTPHVIKDEEQMERMKQLESSRMHWCLADVTEMFGDTGLYDITDGSQDDGAETVYPDADPIGTAPQGFEPQNPIQEGSLTPPFEITPPNDSPTPAPRESESGMSGPSLRDRYLSQQRANQPPQYVPSGGPVNPQYGGTARFAVETTPAPTAGHGNPYPTADPLRPSGYNPPVPSAEYIAPSPDPNASSSVNQTGYAWPPNHGYSPPPSVPPYRQPQDRASYQSDAGWNQWDGTVYR